MPMEVVGFASIKELHEMDVVFLASWKDYKDP